MKNYLRVAFRKLFINNNKESKEFGRVSSLKLCVILFLLNGVFIAEISGQRHEQIHGYSDLKPTNIVSKLLNQENNVDLVNNNRPCKGKYVTAVVENYGSTLEPSQRLYTDTCRVSNPIYSEKAGHQFYSLKNKDKFRIKYVTIGNYQKIYQVNDFGSAGYTKISGIFNTIKVRNSCVHLQFKKICGLPKLRSGTYRYSFLVDQDNKIIDIYQLESIQ